MTKDVSVFVKCDPRFLYCKLPQMRTSEFRKVVQQHTEGMVGSIVCGFCWKLSSLSVKEFWKSVKNRHRRTEPAGFCPTMSYGSRKRSYDQGGCVRRGVWPPSAAYNVEPVTNIIRPRLVRRTVTDTAVNTRLDACRRSRLYFSHFVTRTVYNTVDLYAAIFVQNRVFLPHHLHSTPLLRGFRSEYRHPVWHEKTSMAWLPDMVKKFRRYLYSFWRNSRTMSLV